jgi:hypothetical protein
MKRKHAVACGIVLLVTAVVSITGTQGGLAWFSPFTIEYTTQREFTLLAGALPIYRSAPRGRHNEVAAMLHEEGFAAPTQLGDARCELIFHENNAWRDGFGPLYDVFIRHRKQVIGWSKADRTRARLYWQEGLKHLRSHRQVDIWIGREILSTGWKSQKLAELEDRIVLIKHEAPTLFEIQSTPEQRE